MTTSGQVSGDFYPANVGQLKHFATKAKEYLDNYYNGDSNRDLTSANWNEAYAAFGGNPFPFNNTDNYAPANVGQLKYIAAGIYTILEKHFWDYDVRAGLIAMGNNGSDLGFSLPIGTEDPIYPWAPYTLKSDNAAPINIGQLKFVFSFDLTANFAGVDGDKIGKDDSDGDLFSHMVEYLGGSSGEATFDGSGSGTNWPPNQELSDTIGTNFKVLVLMPDRGIYRVENNLNLNRAGAP